MKQLFHLFIALIWLFVCSITFVKAQGVGVNSSGNSPDSSAGLDVDFTNKGLLAPRVALTSVTDISTIANPATGLLIYNTATAGTSPDNVVPGFYFWNGIKWTSLGGEAGLSGNTAGDMLYWNGSTWVMIPIGQPGQFLKVSDSNIPSWSFNYPGVITTSVTSVTSTSAKSGGSVVSDGGATITARGVCWSTSSNPTVANSKTIDGSGTGTFISSITGLSLGTTYYLRAYATSSVGTAYGNQEVFAAIAIGDTYQGGKVAYILQPGDPGYDAGTPHGIIATPSDQSTGALWGCSGTTISGADGTAIGTGFQNTTDIINGCSTSGIAARLCRNLTLSGYSDWSLPSKDELNKLYINRVAIGGFTTIYFTSTEYDATSTWAQSFSDGTQYNSGSSQKNDSYRVRAIRSF